MERIPPSKRYLQSFLILSLFISSILSNKIIISRYEHFNGLSMKYFIPLAHESGYWRINQQSPYSNSINRGKLNPNKTLYETDTTQSGSNYTRILKYGTIKLANFDASIFYYEIPEKSVPYIDAYDGLTFALNPANESFSIMHLLKKEAQIKKMSYAFDPMANESHQGVFYLGGLPGGVIKNKFKGKCKVSGDEWGCHLNYIYFEGNESMIYKNKHKALFQSAFKAITAPREYMNYLTSTVFKKYIHDGFCYVDKNYYSDYIISCKNAQYVYDTFPSHLNFVFDNIILTIPKNQILYFPNYKTYDRVVCNIYTDLNEELQSIWTFGDHFLSNYITEFNYEDREVIFYSNSTIQTFNLENIERGKRILKVMIVSMSLTIVILWYVKKKKTKEFG